MEDQILHQAVAHQLSDLEHARANGYQENTIHGGVVVSFFSGRYFLTQFVYDNVNEWAHDLELIKTALPELHPMEKTLFGLAAGSEAMKTEDPGQGEEDNDAITFKSSQLALDVEQFDQLRVTNYRRSGSGASFGVAFFRGHTEVNNYAYGSQQDREHDIVNVLKLHPLLIEMGHSQPA